MIGKIDPQTGEMIATGKVGRPAKCAGDVTETKENPKLIKMQMELESIKEEKANLMQELLAAKSAADKANRKLKRIAELCGIE